MKTSLLISVVLGMGLVGATIYWVINQTNQGDGATFQAQMQGKGEQMARLGGKQMRGQAPNSVAVNELEAGINQGEQVAAEQQVLVPYSAEGVDRALAAGERAILFFHANWCPTCRAAAQSLEKNSALIPDDVTIFQADYDKESALKKQFGVVTQDTFVLLDADGNAETVWNSGGDGIGALQNNLTK